MQQPPLYAERDIEKLEPFYSCHVHAMTAEGLNGKSDIAAELAYRDAKISHLEHLLADENERYDLEVNPEGK